jgi:hypothetical protein
MFFVGTTERKGTAAKIQKQLCQLREVLRKVRKRDIRTRPCIRCSVLEQQTSPHFHVGFFRMLCKATRHSYKLVMCFFRASSCGASWMPSPPSSSHCLLRLFHACCVFSASAKCSSIHSSSQSTVYPRSASTRPWAHLLRHAYLMGLPVS